MGKCAEEQIAALLGMNPTQEQQDSLVAQPGIQRQKRFTLRVAISARGCNSVIDYHFVRLVVPEAAPGKVPLLVGSEQHGAGIAQYAILGKRPIERLLQVLERVLPLEPGIEHPMSEYEIWGG